MRDKKYIWALVSVYLAYLTHGIQAIVISQNSANFQQQWGVDAGGISGVIAWTGLGKFVSVWICGEISDKIGRKIMIVIGAIMYVAFFGLLLTTHSPAVASVAAFMAGVATSFFDGACYAVAQESWTKAPGTAVILIKGVISISGTIYPLLVASMSQSGNWKALIILPIIMSVVVLVVALIAPYSYDEELKELKDNKQADPNAKLVDEDAEKGKARIKSPIPGFVIAGCAIYGFIAMATMYSAQQYLKSFGMAVLGQDEMWAASLNSIYTIGSFAAVIIWGVFMAALRWRTLKILLIDLAGSVVAYALVVLLRSPVMVQIGAFAIGFFAAGGALQCGVALMQEFHPGAKGRNLGIYYTFMGAASYIMPQLAKIFYNMAGGNEAQAVINEMTVNLVLAVIGLLFMIFLAMNYQKWFGVSVWSKKGADE
ncbi:MAG TPA: MFS transporter [Lachnospiraceae bacterium]|nr:MFS transporter [Lachnospiraceae bacterium]